MGKTCYSKESQGKKSHPEKEKENKNHDPRLAEAELMQKTNHELKRRQDIVNELCAHHRVGAAYYIQLYYAM